MAKLEEHFRRWRSGEIGAFELADLIHEFHNGENRELYKFYTHRSNPYAVPSAVAKGILEESELSASLLEKLAGDIEHFREGWPEDSE